MTNIELLHGDCLDKLKELDENSVDSVVTDPPYELGFMGKKWDSTGIAYNPDLWKEVYRVLKPGGHLLSFGGSRTYHRMAVAIEDAGFDIRDQIMWVYGSGFPKSMNIGKGVDKKLGNEREVVGENPNHRVKNNNMKDMLTLNDPTITKGNSPYEGWGTALKPAHEPIVMARKPLSEKTIVDNVLEWGTGGINIDESRIGYESEDDLDKAIEKRKSFANTGGGHQNAYVGGKLEKPIDTIQSINTQGRFPANIILDEEAGKILDEQSGISKTGDIKPYKENTKSSIHGDDRFFKSREVRTTYFAGDTGGASRFFYCPKTSKTDRNEGLDGLPTKSASELTGRRKGSKGLSGSVEHKNSTNPFANGGSVVPRSNFHPTVKPTDLMLYLIRLVTPKGGTTLDPFMGSGSTGKGAVRGGFDFIGIEREREYVDIAQARIQYEIDHPYDPVTKKRIQPDSNTSLDQFFD